MKEGKDQGLDVTMHLADCNHMMHCRCDVARREEAPRDERRGLRSGPDANILSGCAMRAHPAGVCAGERQGGLAVARCAAVHTWRKGGAWQLWMQGRTKGIALPPAATRVPARATATSAGWRRGAQQLRRSSAIPSCNSYNRSVVGKRLVALRTIAAVRKKVAASGGLRARRCMPGCPPDEAQTRLLGAVAAPLGNKVRSFLAGTSTALDAEVILRSDDGVRAERCQGTTQLAQMRVGSCGRRSAAGGRLLRRFGAVLRADDVNRPGQLNEW
eukprot:309113-Chlamydomonas_euryale.AAC.4